MSASRAAREAPREHGLLAGAVMSSWDIFRELDALRLHLRGERPRPLEPFDFPAGDVAGMAQIAVTLNTRTIAVIAELKDLTAKMQIR